jgi:hypothetical protein
MSGVIEVQSLYLSVSFHIRLFNNAKEQGLRQGSDSIATVPHFLVGWQDGKYLSSGIRIKSTLPYSRQRLSGCRKVITRFHQQDNRVNSLDRMCRTVGAGSWSSPAHLRNQTAMASNLEGGRRSFQWDEVMLVALVSTTAQSTMLCVRLGGGWSVSASTCCRDLIVGD